MDTPIVKTKIDYESYEVSEEKALLEQFLRDKQWSLSSDFTKQIKTGDIIEIYSFPGHTQVYANKEFQKLSSYTLEQMSTIPFQKLFWRESDIQHNLIRRAIEVVEGGITQPWGIPPHDLVESLHPNRRTFEMHMGWLAPVYNATGTAVGWASTLRVEYIFEWPAASGAD